MQEEVFHNGEPFKTRPGGGKIMDLGRLSSGFHRARWLAELAIAMDEAEATARKLLYTSHAYDEAAALLPAITAARQEIRSLQLGGWRAPVQQIGSKRIGLGNYSSD
ncbi:hypothetical protein G7077_11225 [Sphingomonas piscis]|uniref:Uncharacterized protein n=1 Tax=Sphingomonas piscis TaxID=2714943 RepID=A0A6G7YRL5_9SPHN|nr:hypothetical protein [Sphingomonas piscis]QIK79388.1 hypothetical protein G7077_11225 [Sphingomonas piscis]